MRMASLLICCLMSFGATEPTSAPARLDGRLLDQHDKPLSDVFVCLCTRNLDIYDAKLPQDKFAASEMRQWHDGEDKLWFRQTDGDGQFSFPAPKGPQVLLVSTDAGYVLTKAKRATAQTLRLAPWAKLAGVVKAGDQAVHARMSVNASLLDSRFNDQIGPYLHFQASTDETGRFVFPRVISGEYALTRRAAHDSAGAAFKATAVSGKETDVTISILGPSISGRIPVDGLGDPSKIYIDEAELETAIRLPSLTLPSDILKRSAVDREAWFQQWAQTDEGKRTIAEREHRREERRVTIQPDGTFRALDIPPGKYVLKLSVFARTKDGIDYNKLLALRAFDLIVPPDHGDLLKVVDVGPLYETLHGTLNAGQRAPDFVFRDRGGNDHQLSNYNGKVVLLDFWGTWCGTCVADLSRLKSLQTQFSDNPDFVMISVDADDELANLKEHVLKHQMTWMQVFLGPSEDAWPVKLYQITGYPSYWLIDRNGKVLYNDWHTEGLDRLIAKALGPKEPQ